MKKNILLVDDEEIVHLTIGSYWQECGCEVEKVYDGQGPLCA